MRRLRVICIFFISWGLLITIAGAVLVVKQRGRLIGLSRKIAERRVSIYPVRSAIRDRDGKKIAWTEWRFYLQCPPKRKKEMQNFCRQLGIEFKPVFIKQNNRLHQNIPAEKSAEAVKLARIYRFRLRRNIVRCSEPLSDAAQYFIGYSMLYYGVCGLEAKYNDILQGRAGSYMIMRGPLGQIEKESFKMLLPMQEGREIITAASLFELQTGLFPKEVLQ